MKKISDGFIMLKRYGHFNNACWVLFNNGEGAIVEMPPFKKTERPPHKKAEIFFRKNKIFPKYGFLSHPHWDHCYSLPLFMEAFPETRFVAHSSFVEDPYIKFILRNVRNHRGGAWVMGTRALFDEVFEGVYWRGDLGGEPIYLIHAPKHSYGDTMILFRGAMITGDWYMGDIQDCNDLVKKEDKINSIEKLQKVIKNLNYHVHMLFSAHGETLFYDADFDGVMEECKVDHKGNQVHLPVRFVPDTMIENISSDILFRG